MGVLEGISTAKLGACCAALYLRQPYVALQRGASPRPNACVAAAICARGELLRDPPRECVARTGPAAPGEPDGPVNWVPHHVTIEHGDGLVHVSSRAAMPTVDIKCRLFVLNVPWSATRRSSFGNTWAAPSRARRCAASSSYGGLAGARVASQRW